MRCCSASSGAAGLHATVSRTSGWWSALRRGNQPGAGFDAAPRRTMECPPAHLINISGPRPRFAAACSCAVCAGSSVNASRRLRMSRGQALRAAAASQISPALSRAANANACLGHDRGLRTASRTSRTPRAASRPSTAASAAGGLLASGGVAAASVGRRPPDPGRSQRRPRCAYVGQQGLRIADSCMSASSSDALAAIASGGQRGFCAAGRPRVDMSVFVHSVASVCGAQDGDAAAALFNTRNQLISSMSGFGRLPGASGR